MQIHANDMGQSEMNLMKQLGPEKVTYLILIIISIYRMIITGYVKKAKNVLENQKAKKM